VGQGNQAKITGNRGDLENQLGGPKRGEKTGGPRLLPYGKNVRKNRRKRPANKREEKY